MLTGRCLPRRKWFLSIPIFKTAWTTSTRYLQYINTQLPFPNILNNTFLSDINHIKMFLVTEYHMCVCVALRFLIQNIRILFSMAWEEAIFPNWPLSTYNSQIIWTFASMQPTCPDYSYVEQMAAFAYIRYSWIWQKKYFMPLAISNKHIAIHVLNESKCF